MVEVIATFCSIAGALMMASKTGFSPYAYVLWPLASFLWALEAHTNAMYGLMLTMSIHFCVESYGAYRWVLKEKNIFKINGPKGC